MNYKKARDIIWIIAGALLVMLFGFFTISSCIFDGPNPNATIIILLIGFMMIIAMTVITLKYYRCPNCRRHLGRGDGEYCNYCGVQMEEFLDSQKTDGEEDVTTKSK